MRGRGPADLLLDAWAEGMPLRVVRDRIVGPRSLEREVAAHRDELVALLTTPLGALVARLDDDEREAWSERAAILEHDAGLPRDLADRAAAWWARRP